MNLSSKSVKGTTPWCHCCFPFCLKLRPFPAAAIYFILLFPASHLFLYIYALFGGGILSYFSESFFFQGCTTPGAEKSPSTQVYSLSPLIHIGSVNQSLLRAFHGRLAGDLYCRVKVKRVNFEQSPNFPQPLATTPSRALTPG